MSAPSSAEALLQRILAGAAPLALRAAGARGALPLPPAMLTRVFLHLRADPEAGIREQAEASLAAITAESIREILTDPACPPEVLLHFAPAAAKDESLAELVAFHASAPDDALALIAAQGNSAVIELVLTNQERLLSTPRLLDRLTLNPALRPDQRGRILDLLARFFKADGDAAPAGAETGEDALQALADPERAARVLEVDVGELFAASEIMDGEEFERADDPVVRSVYRKILTLNTGQKAMLAMKGGREERSILVRDTNKVVALCVLRNPRLTEQEVESIAQMRNVSDEVLRYVGTGREWSKLYTVIAALVRNPRTPPGVSMNFIPRLNNRDLKWLGGDKEVPEIIRRNAKRTHDLRTQKTAGPPRRK